MTQLATMPPQNREADVIRAGVQPLPGKGFGLDDADEKERAIVRLRAEEANLIEDCLMQHGERVTGVLNDGHFEAIRAEFLPRRIRGFDTSVGEEHEQIAGCDMDGSAWEFSRWHESDGRAAAG